MPRKKTRRKKPEGAHEFIVVQLERYDVDLNFSVNGDVYNPQYAIFTDDDDPLYKPSSRLELHGRILAPKDREGHEISVGFFGDDSPSSRLNLTLKDVQARGKYGAPEYRSYRGREIPIYDPPKGLAVLHKAWGEPKWSVWVWAPMHFVSDMITLLGDKEVLFLSMHEWKFERKRWIQRIELKTSNPEEE
jgi:hypothetical protein